MKLGRFFSLAYFRRWVVAMEVLVGGGGGGRGDRRGESEGGGGSHCCATGSVLSLCYLILIVYVVS